MRSSAFTLTLMAGVLALSACKHLDPPVAAAPARSEEIAAAPAAADDNLNAVLWMQTSAEYQAVCRTIYRAATDKLDRALKEKNRDALVPGERANAAIGLKPAVIMDVDETVLDNSAAEARMLLQHTCPKDYPAVWDAWLAERAASAIPGAAEFIRTARTLEDFRGRRVRIFLITNRECAARAGQPGVCPQQADTIANLRALGLDSPMLEDELMLKGEQPGWESEKLPRRRMIAGKYRIVLNVGDDLGDFLPDVRRLSLANREQARCRYRDWWGTRWFMIPNPVYGSWQRALGPDLEAALAAPPLPSGC